MSKYLEFEKFGDKTMVMSKKQNRCLGEIIFYKPWKQYTFSPSYLAVFNDECLMDIVKQIKILNREKGKK